MTDYLYSLSLAKQTQSFLMSLGFGFVMGLFYDLFRIVRVSFFKGKAAVIAFDVLYCVFLCFCTYSFCLTVSEGEIRAYILLGSAAGFVIYYFSLGVLIFKAAERITDFVKRIISKILKVILFPFSFVFGKAAAFFKKTVKKSRKSTQKVKNKSNFLLKVNKHLLYNLFVKKQKSAGNDNNDERNV